MNDAKASEKFGFSGKVVSFWLVLSHQCIAMHNVLFEQYAYLPTEQAEIYLEIYVLIYQLYLYCARLVGLEGKHDF